MIATTQKSTKTIEYHEASDFFSMLRRQGKRIVQCHGTFDLVHPGHIVHLEEAKAHGDTLVITLTGEEHVNKGPGRPFFNDTLRVKSLTALECVDHVVVIPFAAAVEAIECVMPHIYCKGKEYEQVENDATGNIADDIETINRIGGEIRYVGSVVHSSSKLLNNHFEVISPQVKEHCQIMASRYTPDQFRDAVESFKDLKVLLIGDVIFDRYSYVSVQGLTTKNRMLSSRFTQEETQCGGALAVYRHLKQFCDKVDFIGLVGREPWVQDLIRDTVESEEDNILRIRDYTTIVKQRFVEENTRSKELSKLFSVNYVDATDPGQETQSLIAEILEKNIHDYDLIMVNDFGHGLMQPAIRDLVQAQAPYLALNCQTNSNNHGFNIINRQYSQADCFTLDEQEMLLACGKRQPEFSDELATLKKTLSSQYGWLTRGSKYTLGLSNEDEHTAPTLENQITDTIGAGDALFAVAALAAYKKLPVDLATFIGQLAGAQAVQIVGNRTPISKTKLLKGGMSLLNQ